MMNILPLGLAWNYFRATQNQNFVLIIISYKFTNCPQWQGLQNTQDFQAVKVHVKHFTCGQS